MMAMLTTTGYEKYGGGSAEAYHYMAEVTRRFYAARSQYLGDPDLVKNPISALLAPAYVQSRPATIHTEHATPRVELKPGLPADNEGTGTTHYCIVDEEGNA